MDIHVRASILLAGKIKRRKRSIDDADEVRNEISNDVRGETNRYH
jgi:hypothetical protein